MSVPPNKPSDGLWPESRRRRERVVGSTLRAWAFFGLRALIFAAVIIALLYLVRMRE